MKRLSGRHCLTGLLVVALWTLSAAAWANQDVVVLLDSSAAMVQGDAGHHAVQALANFINSSGPDTRVALFAFGAEPRRLVTFTPLDATGRSRISSALRELQFAGSKADLSAGLQQALAEILDHGNPQAVSSIVLVTRAGVGSGADESRWILRTLVPAANFNQVRVFSVVRAPSAQGPLRDLAQETGGSFFAVTAPSGFQTALRALAPQLAKPALTPAAALPLPEIAAVPGKFATPLTRAARVQSAFHWWWLMLVVVVVAAVVAVYAIWNLRPPRVFKSHAAPAEPPHGGAHAVLYDINNPNDIRRFELDERATLLGRVAGYDPDVQYILIKEKTVGRCHAVIERRGHTFWLTDQGSVNGTFVNGERINADHALKHGDIVAIHRHEFEFMVPEYFESDATVVGAAREAAAA